MSDHYTHPDPAVRELIARHVAAALNEAADWVADGIGYPIETSLPERPMPDGLWNALVDHVHADADGKWHGNTLDREDTESWLADEAGRIPPP